VTRHPRLLLVGGLLAALVGVGVAAAAFLALEPPAPTRSPGQTGPACAPKPCTAPKGFEVYVSDVHLSEGVVRLEVSFRNSTQAEFLETVSYRHTSPADFSIDPGRNDGRPVFDAGCPDWPEVRVARGGNMGPMPLCFRAATTGLQGAVLNWRPDLGLFSVAGSVPLG
jgi:hypothetical protein